MFFDFHSNLTSWAPEKISVRQGHVQKLPILRGHPSKTVKQILQMLFFCSQVVLWLFNAHFCKVMQSDLCESFVAENLIEWHQCLEYRLQVWEVWSCWQHSDNANCLMLRLRLLLPTWVSFSVLTKFWETHLWQKTLVFHQNFPKFLRRKRPWLSLLLLSNYYHVLSHIGSEMKKPLPGYWDG